MTKQQAETVMEAAFGGYSDFLNSPAAYWSSRAAGAPDVRCIAHGTVGEMKTACMEMGVWLRELADALERQK